MTTLENIIRMEPKVDSKKYLDLLHRIVNRISQGKNNSLSITECKNWGFSAEEIIPYFLLLVDAGILKQRLQVFDFEDNCFEDYIGQIDLALVEQSKVKLLFQPAVNKELVSHFFV